MRMHATALVAVLALSSAALLTGCGEPNSPQGAAQVAQQSIHDGNLSRLKSVLRDQALRDFGTDQGMAQLRQEMSGYAGFEIGTPDFIGAQSTGPTNRTGRYEVDVTGTDTGGSPLRIAFRLLAGCDEHLDVMNGTGWVADNCWISEIR